MSCFGAVAGEVGNSGLFRLVGGWLVKDVSVDPTIANPAVAKIPLSWMTETFFNTRKFTLADNNGTWTLDIKTDAPFAGDTRTLFAIQNVPAAQASVSALLSNNGLQVSLLPAVSGGGSTYTAMSLRAVGNPLLYFGGNYYFQDFSYAGSDSTGSNAASTSPGSGGSWSTMQVLGIDFPVYVIGSWTATITGEAWP